MLRSSLIAIFLLLSPLINAQTLADYTLESIEGETYQVYDILDEGKPIVFYFFFIRCVNCNSVTPALADLYAEYGGNDGCFEVIALNVADDTNTEVQSYAENKNASFPFFTQAENPVILSFLSSFSTGSQIGTPAVLMFAPDRSLIYSGNGINVMSEGPMSSLVHQNPTLPCSAAADIEDSTLSFNLFPNPLSEGPLNVVLEKAGAYEIELFDSAGKSVRRWPSSLGRPQLLSRAFSS